MCGAVRVERMMVEGVGDSAGGGCESDGVFGVVDGSGFLGEDAVGACEVDEGVVALGPAGEDVVGVEVESMEVLGFP